LKKIIFIRKEVKKNLVLAFGRPTILKAKTPDLYFAPV